MHITKRITLYIILLASIFSFVTKYVVYGKQSSSVINTLSEITDKTNKDVIYDFYNATYKEQNFVLENTENSDARHIDVWVTAYTSDPKETDDTPYTTASGSMVRDGVAAANFLPIGTKFKIPDKFGNKTFIVEDRMNKRYDNQYIVDLWFSNKSNAKIFGKRYLKIEIL